ncbi:hypothetical protein JTB14_022311 [Gonioctena quinquepunctata]|nr:hypothetical protein JTB14_022311 [Gonioctena quinquepunctata]
MGGTDNADAFIAHYRSKSRCKKWTVRMIVHAIDMALINSWLEYKKDAAVLGISKKDILDLLHFRMHVVSDESSVVGAVDCCNIEFKPPHEQQDSYINKNSKHFIKLQGLVTSNKIFTNINVGFPGSAHDSRVLKNSNIYVDMMTNNKLKKYFKSEEFHLVGDKTYPLLSWLMTPYKNYGNSTRAQIKHNKRLSC